MTNWSPRFDDPITLPDGRKLRTLRKAGAGTSGSTGVTQL